MRSCEGQLSKAALALYDSAGTAFLARMAEAEDLLKQALLTFRHDHWDDTMQHGRGCKICLKQQEVSKKVYTFLKGEGVKA
jgi:hypothetical protein